MTPCEVIFNKFLHSIDDIELSVLDDIDIEEMLYQYLENATVSFFECKKPLTIVGDSIEGDLDLDEIYILALGMTQHWLSPKIKREENLRQMMNDRDFNQVSSANMLGKLLQLNKTVKEEMRMCKQRYAFKNFKGFD